MSNQAVVVCRFKEFWLENFAKPGESINFTEISLATGISAEAISRIYHNQALRGKKRMSRFDATTMGKLAAHFGVKPDEPIPFLVLEFAED